MQQQILKMGTKASCWSVHRALPTNSEVECGISPSKTITNTPSTANHISGSPRFIICDLNVSEGVNGVCYLDAKVVRSAAVPARVNALAVVLPRRVISNHRHPRLMWKQKRCQAPDRKRNHADRPQSSLNRGLVAWLAETSRTACSSFTPAGVWEMARGGGSSLSNKLAASSLKWEWQCTSCEVVLSYRRPSLLWIKEGKNAKNKGCSVYGLVETEGGDLQCSVCWVRNSGRLSHLPGVWHFILLIQRASSQRVAASARTAVWLQVGPQPIVAPSSPCETLPTQHQGSESHGWMAATTLAPLHMQTLLQHTLSPSNFSSSSSLF